MGTRVPLLANDFVAVFRSPDPQRIYCTTPGITRLESGRLVVTLGVKAVPGVALDGPTCRGEGPYVWQSKVFTSDDGGWTWQHRADLPLLHGRPFVAGDRLYVLGHAGDLTIARSDDEGGTWSDAAALTRGQWWHQAACSVVYARGRVYLVMERRTEPGFPGWPVSTLAPVVLAANTGDDLLARAAWTFSNELTFNDALSQWGGGNLVGSPFYPVGQTVSGSSTTRPMHPPGWLETNLVQFHDPGHVWHDPAGRTFYLWMRAHTGTTNLAAIARAVEAVDGRLTVGLATTPSGQLVLYVPCPGGQMKFFILYDAPSRLYWLVSSQSTDSMVRPERLPPERFGLPNNERHRLALHFSRNCIDWQMAGMVAVGATPRQARHYASLAVDGEDLLVLSRSGDAQAKSAHDCNLITLHRVSRFRDLVY